MATAYAYTRVSTTQQDLSPDEQGRQCEEYFHRHLARDYDWGGIMHDHGESAYKIPWRDRTQGRILLQSAKRGDIIISPKADRLFRSTLDQARSMKELDDCGIKIAILDLQLDTSTAAGKFALQVICAAAEFESGLKSERIAAAAKTRKRRKKPGIASPPPGWYFSQKKGELVPDLIERNIIE